MTKVNDRFEFSRDKNGCTLIEWITGKDKKGNEKRHKYETYYSTVLQVCHVIIDRSAEGETVEDVVDGINAAKRDILAMLKAREE